MTTGIVVPVPELEELVQGLSDRSRLPAHITVLYPFLAIDRLDDAVHRRLTALAGAVTPFDFELLRSGRFPGILWLAPEPAEPFERLSAALTTLWPELPPYGGIHADIVTHATVLRHDDEDALDRMQALIDPLLPLRAGGEEMWLVVVHEPGSWTVRTRYRFGA